MGTTSFISILGDSAGGSIATPGTGTEPAGTDSAGSFADLHLDIAVGSITSGHDAAALAPLFYEPLRDVAAIVYRHEVFRDLENATLLEAIRRFAGQIQTVQRRLRHSADTTYAFDQERWLLGAAVAFDAAIGELRNALASAPVRSKGLTAFRDYLAAYAASEAYAALGADTQRVKSAITAVDYRLLIHGSKVTISRSRPEPDYSAEVLGTFDKFRQGVGKTYAWRFEQGADMNHVEAAILDRVARLYPAPFAALHEFAGVHAEFMEPAIARFEREIQFYLAYLDYVGPLRAAGLPFCYPEVGQGSHTIEARRFFDLALATSLANSGRQIIPNDLELQGDQRVVVVSGPNQGGKTTFSRAVGQLHHLARIGVPVPGERVSLPLVDQIFTHFEREEQVEDLSSKLEDDLRRMHDILERATCASLLIMNESFSSTTVDDQLFISRRVLRQIVDCGLLCVLVTFLDELAVLDPATVSMVSSVDPAEPARRTFEIVRRPADGLAYAMAIAEKHHLTYAHLKERLAR